MAITEKQTAAWRFQVWTAFAASTLGMLLGILVLPISFWPRAFLFLGYLFSVSSCFSLAKTVRDDHEAGKLINRIQDVKTEKILRDLEPPTVV